MNQAREDSYYGDSTQRTQYEGTRGTNSTNYQRSQTQQPYQQKPTPPKEDKKWVKGIVILVIALLLIAVLMSPVADYIPHLWGGPVYPESARFTIERKITLSTNREINYTVNAPKPFDINGNVMQTINDVDWTGEPIIGEQFGQPWMFWNEILNDGETDEIIITYEVETRTVKWDYSSQYSGTVEDIDQDLKDLYNRDQWVVTDRHGNPEDRNGDGRNDVMIEPNHPTIRNLARDITKDEDNIYDKSRAIYRWIRNNIEYERGAPGLPQHAYWTLDSRMGDCDEQAFLFISLARAVDIPAWIELGVLYDRVIDEWGGHGWIRMQFVDDVGNSGWVNIDTTNRQFFARDATRFTTWVDDGLEGHLETYYYFLTYRHQSDGPAPQVSINEQYTNLQMETEGQVYLGDDGFDIPSIGVALIIPTVVIFSIIWEKKRVKK